MYCVYWLISKNQKSTYVGYSQDIMQRIKDHKIGKVSSTRNFGNFRCFQLEYVNDVDEAIKREKYWKSAAGRRKLKGFYNDICKPLSSSG